VEIGKKILIIQTAFIGDVILTTPLIVALKDEFPGAKIDFLTTPKSKDLLDANPKINNLIIFDKRGKDQGLKGLIRVGQILHENHYDLCITPHRSLRSAFLAWKTKAKIRVGFNTSAWKKAFSHIVTYKPDHHEIERNLSLLSAIGIERQKSLPVLHYNQEDKRIVDALLTKQNLRDKTLFAVAPGSVWPTKRWPEAYFSEFCESVTNKGYHVVLLGGPEDLDLCNRIAGKSKKIFTTTGTFNLRETFYLLNQCTGILSNDSAPLHLGLAANIRVFAIFGPTVPAFGFAPFGPKSKIFENSELACRPCAIHGSKKCPVKTFDCMREVIPSKVVQEVIDELSDNS
jgi:heptosyltransferase-2